MIIPSYVGTYPKDKYLERRKKTVNLFTKNITDSQEFSLSKNYFCIIDMVETTKKNISFTKISLFDWKRKLIIQIERNTLETWICLIDDHPITKKDYFLAGEDIQGYSVYNINDKIAYSYISDDIGKGKAFEWHEVIPSPSGLSIAVIGSYFRSPLELVFYDFSNPDSLPLKELNRHHLIDYDEVEGWQDEDIFSLAIVNYFRKGDGMPFEELHPDECDFLLKNPDLFERTVHLNKYSKIIKESVVD